jgi:cell division septum initiation protein DivIVA
MTLRRQDTGQPTADAINSVLAAEREANQAIGEAKSEAERILDAARQRAARILQRADARITYGHLRCSTGVARAIDGQILEHHRRLAELSHRLELDDAQIDAIVAALAAALTGGGPEGGDGP